MTAPSYIMYSKREQMKPLKLSLSHIIEITDSLDDEISSLVIKILLDAIFDLSK